MRFPSWHGIKNGEHVTLLPNGTIKFKGKLYTSPTAAAKQIIERKTVNGWTFWFVEDEEGNWVTLNDLKI